MTRTPVVAGMFYEADAEKLEKQIEKCFMDNKFGPGRLPGKRSDRRIIGVVAPHAGYMFSGAGQAICYKEIGEAEFPDVYVILGTSHMGCENAAATTEDFQTPFGIVKTDAVFAERLISKKAVFNDKYPHIREHSIEVQLPFLQFVSRDNADKLRIAAIVVSPDADYEKLGKAIADTAKELKKKIVLIASSDFTHYGIGYGYLPFKSNIKDNLTRLDGGAIQWIKKLDAWSFIDYVDEKEATICGEKAIAALIVACNRLGAKIAKAEQYYSSGEITNEWDTSVGYASIIVE